MKKASRKTARSSSRAAKSGGAGVRPRYNFRGGVRGKYAGRAREGSNIVLLDPDVAARFPNAEAVNEALRALADVADGKTARPRSKRRTA